MSCCSCEELELLKGSFGNLCEVQIIHSESFCTIPSTAVSEPRAVLVNDAGQGSGDAGCSGPED